MFKGGGTQEDGKLDPLENEALYPEPWMFGTVPASGFFIRHARNVELNNVQIDFMEKDYRPTLWMKDVDGCRLLNYRSKVVAGVEPYNLTDVQNFKTELTEISDF